MVFRARNTPQGPVLVQGPGCGVPPTKAVLCSRAPPPAPPSRPSCSFPPQPKSLSYLHPTSWMLLPLLIYSWLPLTAFSLCLLASALAKTELCLSGGSLSTPRERVGWLRHCHPCWVLVSCRAALRPPARLWGVYLCVRCTP